MDFYHNVFKKQSLRDKLFGVLICQIFSLYLFGFFIFSILFHKPILMCEKDGIIQECTQKEACGNQYFISDESYQTLSFEYELVCDRDYMSRDAAQIIYVQGLFGTIAQFFFAQNVRTRYLFMLGCVFFSSMFYFSVLFTHNLYWQSFLIGTASQNLPLLWLNNIISFCNEQFKSKMFADFIITFFTIALGVNIIVFFYFFQIFQFNWRTVFFCLGVLELGYFFIFYYFYTNRNTAIEQVSEDEQDDEKNLLKKYYGIMSQNPILKKNFILKIIQYISYSVVWNSMGYEIDNLGGSMVESVTYAGLGDILGAIFALKVITSIDKETNQVRRFELILSFSMIMQALTKLISHYISNIFIVFIMISNAIVYSVFNSDVSRFIPNSIIPYVMSASVFFARFIVQLSTKINYYFYQLTRLSPILLYGLMVYVFSTLALQAEPLTDDIKEIETIVESDREEEMQDIKSDDNEDKQIKRISSIYDLKNTSLIRRSSSRRNSLRYSNLQR